MKGQIIDAEKTFANHISGKGVVSDFTYYWICIYWASRNTMLDTVEWYKMKKKTFSAFGKVLSRGKR